MNPELLTPAKFGLGGSVPTRFTLYYSDSLANVSGKTIPTDDGSDLRLANGSLTGSGGWPGMASDLKLKNLITETGVVHEVSDVLMPRTVELNVGKLARAAKGSLMASMMIKAGFDWVLNATAPPEDSPWEQMGLDGKGWTLLCPPDDALKHVNMTELLKDTERLKKIIGQHPIPTPSSPSTTFTRGKDPRTVIQISQYPCTMTLHIPRSYLQTMRTEISSFGHRQPLATPLCWVSKAREGL